MKDWEDIIKERQLSRKAELPESDWNDFLSRKAANERAAMHRRKIIAAAISIPAAAAVLLLLFLIPFKKVVPDNSLSQNNPPAPQVITDSVELAKYEEHIRRDIPAALRLTEQAIARSSEPGLGQDDAVQEMKNELQYRWQRLKRKLEEQ